MGTFIGAVERDGEGVARRTVDGWGRFPDGAEVVYLYDQGDVCSAFAVNRDWADGSERGTRRLRLDSGKGSKH
ncbi:MAG: hypothetical protein M3R02_30115 [Chloroflexota bacterium]|nr:hypothetical protein [Chloroflexota bacterium]